jgi:hypothetical protein
MTCKEKALNQVEWNDLKSQGSEHYKTGGVEPIDLYVAGGIFKQFSIASIIKYAFRSRDLKDTDLFIKNMDKIIDYAQKLKAWARCNNA